MAVLLKYNVIICMALCTIVFFPPARSIAESPIWAPAEVSKLIEEGLSRNQDIQSLKSQVESLKNKIDVAGSLDDPRLGLALLNLPSDSFAFDEEPMTQKQIFIAQKFPWFGKLDLRTQRAALATKRQEAILATKQLELARQIAVAYYELAFIHSSLKINSRLKDRLKQTLEVADVRYSSGRGLQQDVFMVQVEIGKLLDEKIILNKKRRISEDRINELLNRDSFEQIDPVEPLSYVEFSLNVQDLQAQAIEQNPLLKVKSYEEAQAKIEIDLAKKEYWPDMDVQVAYGQRDENKMGQDWQDFVSASVVMNIPLWQHTKQSGNLAASKANQDAFLKSYKNMAAGLRHRIDALVTEITELQKSYRHYTDILITQTKRWAKSSQADYEVGKVEFSTMIDAQIRVLRFELQADNYLYMIYQKRAELEELVGGPCI